MKWNAGARGPAAARCYGQSSDAQLLPGTQAAC